MAALKETMAGPGYVILNAVRVMNIVILLDIIAASVVMLVKIHIENSFFFFDAVTHSMTAIISIALIISELPLFQDYFDRNWPLFGERSGFVALGLVILILGLQVLGALNTAATSQDALGLAFWRIVVSAGILAMVMSVINLLSSFIFSDRGAGVSARQVRSYGAVAPHKAVAGASSYRSFKLGLKRDALPMYNTSSPSTPSASLRNGPRFPLKISAPINPIINDAVSSKYSRDSQVAVPNLAHHPAMSSSHV